MNLRKKCTACLIFLLVATFACALPGFQGGPAPAKERFWIIFYADYPNINTGSYAGHAFVSLIKEDLHGKKMEQCWGFYPKEGIGLFGDVPGDIRNDLARQKDIGLEVEVTPMDYQNALLTVNRWRSRAYNLNTSNCVHFLEDIASRICNLRLPYFTYYIPADYVYQLKVRNANYSLCRDIPTLFLFDLSGSMNDPGASLLPKIEEAKAAAQQTLKSIAATRSQSSVGQEVALFGFNGECTSDPTFLISNFTTDLSAAERAIRSIPQPGGGTPLYEAIEASKGRMAGYMQLSGAKKSRLIILSDGMATCTPIRPETAYALGTSGQAAILLSPGIKYFTIGFGIVPGSPAERDLQYLASLTGGKYLNAQNQVELTRAFQKFNRVFTPKFYPRMDSLSKDSWETFDLGLQRILSEAFVPALESYKDYYQQHPDDCHGAYNLALMLEANEYYKSAVQYYEKYLQLCPEAADEAFVRQQIELLKEDYRAFLVFNKKVIQSDFEYLDQHFQKIQNGESVALAAEFKAFLLEKFDYYQNLPAILEITTPGFVQSAKQVSQNLSESAAAIRRNPKTWDVEATPVLGKAYFNLERLLQTF